MSNDNTGSIVNLKVGSGAGDRFNYDHVDDIRCPDCQKAWLKLAKDTSYLVCPNCGLLIPETELDHEVKYVPIDGFGLGNKPYIEQQGANKIHTIEDPDRHFVAMAIQQSDTDILKQYSLSGLAGELEGDTKIVGNRTKMTQETLDVVNKMVGQLGTFRKVYIE
jgi:hypothetical protein